MVIIRINRIWHQIEVALNIKYKKSPTTKKSLYKEKETEPFPLALGEIEKGGRKKKGS